MCSCSRISVVFAEAAAGVVRESAAVVALSCGVKTSLLWRKTKTKNPRKTHTLGIKRRREKTRRV